MVTGGDKMGMKERNAARRKCPNCGNTRIFPRTKTKDWHCVGCGAIITDDQIPDNL